jgi:hypothetical protein
MLLSLSAMCFVIFFDVVYKSFFGKQIFGQRLLQFLFTFFFSQFLFHLEQQTTLQLATDGNGIHGRQ